MKQLTKELMAYIQTLSFENIYILSIKDCRGNFLVKSIWKNKDILILKECFETVYLDILEEGVVD